MLHGVSKYVCARSEDVHILIVVYSCTIGGCHRIALGLDRCSACTLWRLDGPQNQSGRFEEEKNIFVMSGIEPKFFSIPTLRLVTIPTELFRFQKVKKKVTPQRSSKMGQISSEFLTQLLSPFLSLSFVPPPPSLRVSGAPYGSRCFASTVFICFPYVASASLRILNASAICVRKVTQNICTSANLYIKPNKMAIAALSAYNYLVSFRDRGIQRSVNLCREALCVGLACIGTYPDVILVRTQYYYSHHYVL
jgi:hypothetical protein